MYTTRVNTSFKYNLSLNCKHLKYHNIPGIKQFSQVIENTIDF